MCQPCEERCREQGKNMIRNLITKEVVACNPIPKVKTVTCVPSTCLPRTTHLIHSRHFGGAGFHSMTCYSILVCVPAWTHHNDVSSRTLCGVRNMLEKTNWFWWLTADSGGRLTRHCAAKSRDQHVGTCGKMSHATTIHPRRRRVALCPRLREDDKASCLQTTRLAFQLCHQLWLGMKSKKKAKNLIKSRKEFVKLHWLNQIEFETIFFFLCIRSIHCSPRRRLCQRFDLKSETQEGGEKWAKDSRVSSETRRSRHSSPTATRVDCLIVRLFTSLLLISSPRKRLSGVLFRPTTN